MKEAFILIVIHFIGDFVVQTHNQAINKSKSNKALFTHVFTYSIVMILGLIMWDWANDTISFNINKIAIFYSITFVCHFMTDYVTSRINASLYAANRTHDFFVSVGFDQVLHYAQLFLTFQLIQSI